jgi:hypothetical protein
MHVLRTGVIQVPSNVPNNETYRIPTVIKMDNDLLPCQPISDVVYDWMTYVNWTSSHCLQQQYIVCAAEPYIHPSFHWCVFYHQPQRAQLKIKIWTCRQSHITKLIARSISSEVCIEPTAPAINILPGSSAFVGLVLVQTDHNQMHRRLCCQSHSKNCWWMAN